MYTEKELEFLDNFTQNDLLSTLKNILSDNKSISNMIISNDDNNVHLTFGEIVSYLKEQNDLYDPTMR